MSEQTKIAWCDSTINWWEGCTKVSEGCRFCYAEERNKRFFPQSETGTGFHWGAGRPRRKSKSAVKDALAYNRKPWICPIHGGNAAGAICQCGATSHRRRIFSLSLGDWLDDEVPIEWLAEMLDTIRQCDQVEWILCTKRPENFFDRIEAIYGCYDLTISCEFETWLMQWRDGHPPSHIILLASVENQEQADIRIPQLLQIPARVRGLSMEPLLGTVSIRQWLYKKETAALFPNYAAQKINWLIIGGESGRNARPCNVDWIRDIVRQGQAAGVPVFVKQLGAAAVEPDPHHDYRPFPSKDKKGGDMAEWPEDLRVQEFYK